MNNKLEVIGIDHGWSMMKTISQVFVTGVKEITTTPALFGDVLEYEGKFYKVGTVRQEVKDTKVEDDSFYLLTLAAVAKELKRRGLAEAKVFLAVGLPLTRFGAEKNDFIKYLTKNKRVSFKYENEPYYIEIDDVAVFPQCYAAVVDKISTMAKKTLIVDIGSWTIDIIYDDRLLVKPVKLAVRYMPTAPYELPYDGAKRMLLVEEVDNKKFLTGLFDAMYAELPAPKQKRGK